MSGCDWQNKSFSVSLLGKTIFYCSKCKIELIGQYFTLNKNKLCKYCFNALPSKNNFCSNFYVQPSYDFIDENTTGKPIHFHSKRQWKNHLKSLNLTDDFQQSVKGKTYKQLQDTFKPTSKEEIKKIMIERFKETGAYEKLIRRK